MRRAWSLLASLLEALPAKPRPRNRLSARRAADCRSGRAEGGRVTAFKTSVRIRRPIEEVFAFVSEPLNFPHWNSAVRAVRKTHGRDGEVGSTYTMERELPSGGVQNELEVFARGRRLEVFARGRPTEFGIRTTSGPTPFITTTGFPRRMARRSFSSTQYWSSTAPRPCWAR